MVVELLKDRFRELGYTVREFSDSYFIVRHDAVGRNWSPFDVSVAVSGTIIRVCPMPRLSKKGETVYDLADPDSLVKIEARVKRLIG